MKKMSIGLIFLFTLLFLLSFVGWAANEVQAASDSSTSTSPPIAHGKISRNTDIYWGKGEMYPTLERLKVNTEQDIYEYDKNWVMVLYKTSVTYGGKVADHSFYGYINRSDIICDPPLEGEKSAKAKTGPNRPKKQQQKQKIPSEDDNQTSKDKPKNPQDSSISEPNIPGEDLEEFDWIIRTPGTSHVSVDMGDGVIYVADFSLMAQKFGGVAPSSDPLYNDGKRNPYAAIGIFSLTTNMDDMLENLGVSEIVSGSGGVTVSGQSSSAQFYVNTKSEDFTSVNFTLNLAATATVNPGVTDGNIKMDFNMSTQSKLSIPVQIKKVGSSYKCILVGMRPGGGNLEFPAVLEKTFTDTNSRDKWKKEAKEADLKRKQREEAQRKANEKLKKLQDKIKEDYRREQEANQYIPDPLTKPEDNFEPYPLTKSEDNLDPHPLTKPEDDFKPEPLTKPEDNLDPHPLTRSDSDSVENFPNRQSKP